MTAIASNFAIHIGFFYQGNGLFIKINGNANNAITIYQTLAHHPPSFRLAKKFPTNFVSLLGSMLANTQ